MQELHFLKELDKRWTTQISILSLLCQKLSNSKNPPAIKGWLLGYDAQSQL